MKKRGFQTLVLAAALILASAALAAPPSIQRVTTSSPNGPAPLSTVLEVEATAADGEQIVKYEWDFNGNGTFETVEDPMVPHTYTTPGTYAAVVRVTSSTGETVTGTVTSTAVAGPRLLSSVAGSGVHAPGTVYVDVEIANVGTNDASSVVVRELSLYPAIGEGQPVLNASLSPSFPYSAGSIAVGASKTVRVYVDVPSTLSKFNLRQNVLAQDPSANPFVFALAQTADAQ